MAGIGDFQQLVSSDPTFGAAWGDIQAQLEIEGAPDLTGAKIAFADAFSQLASQSFGVSPTDAIAAAKQYVLAGQTVAGAVGTVTGLVQELQSGAPPTQIAQAFTGTMIGAAVALGAVSAGVGAAIVGVVGAVLSVIDSTGLLGKPVPTYHIGPDFDVTQKPDFVVGYVPAYGPTVSPGSAAWRSFPDEKADARWYKMAPSVQTAAFDWKGVHWIGGGVGMYAKAPIDNAFSDYQTIRYLPPSFGAPFTLGYQRAWKANREYELNGLKSQPDWTVLQHFLRMWNRAHGDSQTFRLQPSATGNYWQKTASDLVNNLNATDPLVSNGTVLIHMSPQAAPPVAPSVVTGALLQPDPTAVAHLITQVLSQGQAAARTADARALIAKVKAASPSSSSSSSWLVWAIAAGFGALALRRFIK